MDLVGIAPSDELLALQRAAYAVEARLLGDDRIPALHEDRAGLDAAGLTWLGAFEGERLVGAIAWTQLDTLIDVHRLVVRPDAHRRGVGRALAAAVTARAGVRRVIVATGRGNAPARRLYESLGFERVGDDEALPGLWVSRYERVIVRDE